MKISRSGDYWDEFRINSILVKTRVHKFKNASSKFVSTHFEDRQQDDQCESRTLVKKKHPYSSSFHHITDLQRDRQGILHKIPCPSGLLPTYLLSEHDWMDWHSGRNFTTFFPSAALFSLCPLKKLDCLWLIAKGGLISERFSLCLKSNKRVPNQSPKDLFRGPINYVVSKSAILTPYPLFVAPLISKIYNFSPLPRWHNLWTTS